ncbi:flagellar motor switch protein FliG [Pelagibacterium flavum]|uniref:Flagellar motor switch protein FliG n=1 Tax=Pelagibacterium flavum TaxID=2984530 RepID=A0ABY6IV64_9HYPH|nr:flagellar motor switch protein FliG [Pelagibacterium sp. YIM 151497]MAN76088.1 flagellar motor switch protein FliG [Hyphomicrobiales bacterium]UYQ73080.1 flagellar motor switch protein FliG [Pelagibacterium sp. YIM 151497]|tara:strand:- start:2593 stop:3669 length:1077 start_codon:yes stop_codon:yes gene_type:complete
MALTEPNAPQNADPIKQGLQVGEDATQRQMRGDEKAAALLLALGPDFGRPILEELDEIEIRILSRAMVRLGAITQQMLDELLAEFIMGVSSTGPMSGNSDTTERLLLSFLPQDRVEQIMEEIRGPAGRNIWEKLSNVQEDILASYLKNEYPQTIAVVLTKLSPDHASRVLSVLPEELALDVVQRMLSIDPVQKEILEKIESTLRTEFMSTLSHTQRRDSHEQMADIFNAFDRQTEARFMTALEDLSRDSAERIKSLMFTFDDLTRLESAAIQTLLQNFDKKEMALALKGASDAAREFFFANMSTRAAGMMRDDMEAMGAVRLKDVDEAQSRLVNTAKDLAARGEIVINKGKADEEMIL